MASTPKLSVCCITFNHECYLAQALDSALEQKVDFPYEIVIAEDGSTDGTLAIAQEYARRRPDIVRLLSPAGNLGVKANLLRCLAACRGEYLAWLEGDDYWTDAEKLARQVAFLEANPSYSGTAHPVHQVHFQGGDLGTFPTPVPIDVTLDDLLEVNRFATCSVVYRWGYPVLPSWYSELLLGDWPLHILHAMRGPFRVLPQTMGVYRVHPQGVWSGQRDEGRLRHALEMYDLLDAAYPDLRPALRRHRAFWEYVLAHRLAARGELADARHMTGTLVRALPLTGIPGLVRFAGAALHVTLPTLYQAASPLWIRPQPNGGA